MKKAILFFAMLGVFAVAANAQQKACCASKKASADKESCSKVDQATLDKAASEDASIVKQVSNTGDATFVRKTVDETTGNVTYTEVEYCTKVSKFINVSPDGEKVCTKDGAKASATKVSEKDKKACCKGDKKGASCSGDKKASKSDDSKTN